MGMKMNTERSLALSMGKIDELGGDRDPGSGWLFEVMR